jgi:hypothetical protein
LQRAYGGKNSLENGQPEEFINGPLKSGIACFADLPTHHHLNGCGPASIETLVSLIGVRSNDDAFANKSALAILSTGCFPSIRPTAPSNSLPCFSHEKGLEFNTAIRTRNRFVSWAHPHQNFVMAAERAMAAQEKSI